MLATVSQILVITSGLGTFQEPLHPPVGTVYNYPLTPGSAFPPSPMPIPIHRPVGIVRPPQTFPSAATSVFEPHTTSGATCPLHMPPGILVCTNHFQLFWEGRGIDGTKTLFHALPNLLIQEEAWRRTEGLERGIWWDCPMATLGGVMCDVRTDTLRGGTDDVERRKKSAVHIEQEDAAVVQRIVGRGKVRQWTVGDAEGVYEARDERFGKYRAEDNGEKGEIFVEL